MFYYINQHLTFVSCFGLNWIWIIRSSEVGTLKKFSFTNIEVFKFSWYLPLCVTGLEDSINSSNFSARGYLSLIRKDFITHGHSLPICVKVGRPFAWNLSSEKHEDSY